MEPIMHAAYCTQAYISCGVYSFNIAHRVLYVTVYACMFVALKWVVSVLKITKIPLWHLPILSIPHSSGDGCLRQSQRKAIDHAHIQAWGDTKGFPESQDRGRRGHQGMWRDHDHPSRSVLMMAAILISYKYLSHKMASIAMVKANNALPLVPQRKLLRTK